MKFELTTEPMPIPLSCDVRDGEVVLILAEGAVVDAALVRAMNDLARPADDDQ